MKKLNIDVKGIMAKIKKKKGDDPEKNEEKQSDEVDALKKKSFFGKVSDMFNYEPQKERVLNREDFNAAGDVYYASVSALYKVAERLLWLILVVFMIFSLVTNYKEITYNNFFYLLRDFSTAADSQTSNYQILSYDSSNRQNFALYRGGLVSAAPSTVSVFTAGGRRTLKSNNDYYSPNVVCCDKYVLVYDTASAAFSVYNSFSKVYNESLESPITDACFDGDGSFAVATRRNDIKTEIFLYGKNINRRGNISDTRFVFDMTLDNSADRFAAIYYDDGNGVGTAAICVYDIGSSSSAKKIGEVELSGEFPLACSFLEGGELAVITNRSIRIFDKRLDEIDGKNFNGASVSAFSATPDGAAVVANNGVPKTVIAYDSDGKLIYNADIGENVSEISVKEDFIFLRTVAGVTRLKSKSEDSEFLPSEGGKMLIYSKDTAIVCGEAKAEYLVFEKKK